MPSFYCRLCAVKIGEEWIPREFKIKSWYDKELHMRRLHSDVMVRDAIKKYTYDADKIISTGDILK